MARIFPLITFLALLAPAAAWAQAGPLIFRAPFYVFPDATLITPLPVECHGDNKAFSQEAEVLITARVDGERAEFAPSAPPLKPDLELTRIAQLRSCDMAHGAAFSHTNALGHFIVGDMVRSRFGVHDSVGENIMETDGTRSFSVEEFAGAAVEGWMKSPDHRAIIISPQFDSSGVGVAKVGSEAVAAQVFHGPPRKRAGSNF